MERAEVVTFLRAKASELLGAEDLAEGDALDGPAVDSLAVVELVMEVEDAYGVELAEEEVAAAATVGALADLVLGKVSGKIGKAGKAVGEGP